MSELVDVFIPSPVTKGRSRPVRYSYICMYIWCNAIRINRLIILSKIIFYINILYSSTTHPTYVSVVQLTAPARFVHYSVVQSYKHVLRYVWIGVGCRQWNMCTYSKVNIICTLNYLLFKWLCTKPSNLLILNALFVVNQSLGVTMMRFWTFPSIPQDQNL